MGYRHVFLLFVLVLSSCASKKDILYFQDNASYSPTVLNYEEPTIQPNDNLIIQVSALDMEAAEPYNFQMPGNGMQMNAGNNAANLQGYIVNKNFEINFPVLGKLSVKGQTVEALEETIRQLLIDGQHLANPTVRVRISNAKFTVLGELGGATINFTDQNLTILQAIGLAGDLTINGKRDDIILIREIDGVRTVAHLDLTSLDKITQSPYYFIKPNDVIYVQPNGPAVKRAGYLPSLGALLGLVSFGIGLALLIQNN
jgi:polysaccharide export outer membrane protein